MRNAAADGIGTGWARGWANLPGRVFVSYTPIAFTPWFLAITVEEHQVFAISNALRRTNTTIAALTVVILSLSTLLLLRLLLKPLGSVEKSIGSIASGHADLTQRIRIVSRTEIGSVVQGFNKFTEVHAAGLHDKGRAFRRKKRDKGGAAHRPVCHIAVLYSSFCPGHEIADADRALCRARLFLLLPVSRKAAGAFL